MDQPELRYGHMKYDVKCIMDDPKVTLDPEKATSANGSGIAYCAGE